MAACTNLLHYHLRSISSSVFQLILLTGHARELENLLDDSCVSFLAVYFFPLEGLSPGVYPWVPCSPLVLSSAFPLTSQMRIWGQTFLASDVYILSPLHGTDMLCAFCDMCFLLFSLT